MAVQLDMFGAPAPAAPKRAKDPFPTKRGPTIEERFEAFQIENPHVLPEMLKLARARLVRGDTYISAKGLWEDLRTYLKTTGQPYKLNNSFTALAARELVGLEPKLEGVIEMRTRRKR